ncbi:MAG: hypothetical protein K2O08_02265 [Clostridia bacterium]|nr:hypothetical protein [Clostridia bacterium]
MELLIVSSVVYLILMLFFYLDGFIKNSAVWIAFCAIYALSLLTENRYLLFVFTAVATAICVALYADVTIGDFIEVLPLTVAAAFWLSTAEFVDGFVFSQLAVAGGVVAISYLLFSPQKRLYLAITAILFSYGVLFAVNGDYDINAFALSVCVIWIFCPVATSNKRFNALRFRSDLY